VSWFTLLLLCRKSSQAIHNGKGETVTHSTHRTTPFLSVIFVALLLTVAAVWSASPQEKRAPQTAGVDDTKMGPYRALAQVIFSASQKGDPGTAAQLARVLELLWDKAEDYGGDTALSKTNHKLFGEIDKAMDQFVTPLKDYKTKAPDAAKVKASYNTYLEKLRLAD
jgi:hypothetical protein